MRTTLTLDDDVLQAARDRARREGRSIGEVISELARQALTSSRFAREATTNAELQGAAELHGFRPLPSRGGVVSNALIDELREDEAG